MRLCEKSCVRVDSRWRTQAHGKSSLREWGGERPVNPLWRARSSNGVLGNGVEKCIWCFNRGSGDARFLTSHTVWNVAFYIFFFMQCHHQLWYINRSMCTQAVCSDWFVSCASNVYYILISDQSSRSKKKNEPSVVSSIIRDLFSRISKFYVGAKLEHFRNHSKRTHR